MPGMALKGVRIMKKRFFAIMISAAMAAGLCGTEMAVTAADDSDSAEWNGHKYQLIERSMT